MAKSLLRQPMARKQGTKILAYGIDGSGKSVFGLSFPKVAVIDTESKLGVYEGDADFGKNIVAVADTSNYYDTLDVIEEILGGNLCDTLMIDSETYIKEAMEVACMEIEEERARKKGGNVDDQTVSMRGWGKVKLNSNRLRLLKAQASAKGMTIISTSHKEDVMQKMGSDMVKVGEKPALRKNSQHDYDVILRFYKEKDMITGKMKYLAEVEKDTTRTLEIGSIVENPSYELFRAYIEKSNSLTEVKTSYDKNIDKDINKGEEEAKNFDDLVAEFVEKFKELGAKDVANKTKVQAMLKAKGIDSYKNAEHADKLQEVLNEMNNM